MGMMTWLSMLAMPRKLPRFSSTPTTSSRRAPILIFLPRGDSRRKRLVATSLPMTQTGRPPSASPAVKNRPWADVKPAVSQELFGGANDRHAGRAAILVADRRLISTTGATAAGQGHLPFHRLDLIERDDPALVLS